MPPPLLPLLPLHRLRGTNALMAVFRRPAGREAVGLMGVQAYANTRSTRGTGGENLLTGLQVPSA